MRLSSTPSRHAERALRRRPPATLAAAALAALAALALAGCGDDTPTQPGITVAPTPILIDGAVEVTAYTEDGPEPPVAGPAYVPTVGLRFTNVGSTPAEVRFGSCSVDPAVWDTEALTGAPLWEPPDTPCTDQRYTLRLAPGETVAPVTAAVVLLPEWYAAAEGIPVWAGARVQIGSELRRLFAGVLDSTPEG